MTITKLSRFYIGIATLSLSVILSGCGGGGSNPAGNSGSNNGNPAPGTIASITTNIFTNDTYDSSELSEDPDTGQTIVRTKLAILFKPAATEDEVNGLLSRINAIITASIAGARSVSIRIPDPGSVAALNAIITDIKSEIFVEAVLKSWQIQPKALPDNVSEKNTDDLKIIDNQLAIGGPAAWNAKEAIVAAPNVLISDGFGYGGSQLDSFLNANISGTVYSGAAATNPDDHGYHVAGILNGSFGGGSSTAALVTGIFPGQSNLYIIDDSHPISEYDWKVLLLLTAETMGGTVIMNTSLGWTCANTTTTGTCNETIDVMEAAITWADMVRSAAMESRIFHATAAGNRENPRYDARDTETVSDFSAAATMTAMATADGIPVPALTNTVSVENLSGTGGHPRRIRCLDVNSFVGGTLSAIGTDVTSLSFTGTATYSGTSMATPQVAGLSAYLLAIDPTLSPQDIKKILLDTAQTVPTNGGVDCSDWGSPAPAIDAYAAVLALDNASALTGSSRTDAPVRNAILDIADGSGLLGKNGQFDEFDLMYFTKEIDAGTEESRNHEEVARYSRSDLNGDGYNGGREGFKQKFNLDIDYPPTFTTVKQTIEGQEVEFDENSVTDNDILCYYAYSNLYTGDATTRKDLMENRCRSSDMAVYYAFPSVIDFPFTDGDTTCVNADENVNELYENVTLLKDLKNPFDRPDSHYWFPGDSNSYQEAYGKTGITRLAKNSNSDCIPFSYTANTIVDATLAYDDKGKDKLLVDITSTAESECRDLQSIISDEQWVCSKANQGALWIAVFDLDITIASNFNLKLNFTCTGPNISPPGYPDLTNPSILPPSDLSVVVGRVDKNGDGVAANRDIVKLSSELGPKFYYCNDDHPTIDVQQLMEFDEPLTKGTTDRVTIIVMGNAGANGNLGNAPLLTVPPTSVPTETGQLGLQTNITTMFGSVEVAPAN
jgi:hypothetical protein